MQVGAVKRNPAIELLRVLMMFGVCLEHAIWQCGYVPKYHVTTNFCVCGFVFISGYFGIRFTWNKVLRLVGLGVFGALVAVATSVLCGGGELNVAGLAKTFIGDFRGWWFLWAYVVLMCFAPLINAAVDGCSKRDAIAMTVPLLICVYVWMMLAGFPVLRDILPTPRGFGGCSFLSLIGVYVAVRLAVKLGYEKYMNGWIVVGSIVLYFALGLLKLWAYWYVPAFLISASLFWAFRQMRLPGWLERVSLFLSPSMFSVYLLHMAGPNLYQMKLFEKFCVEDCKIPIVVAYFVTAAVAFCVCLGVDALRRLALAGGWRID